MDKPETKTQEEFVDTGFGFPVRLRNVLMIKVRGTWTPKLNYNSLAKAVLYSLAFEPSRLTGAEIKFIRTHFEMTLQQFAQRFCVTHAAVIKWEKAKDEPTVMNWSTEKDVRMFILTKLNVEPVLFVELYAKLAATPTKQPAPLNLDAKLLAA